jgi:nucleotide-binding universal stress UspA family protein
MKILLAVDDSSYSSAAAGAVGARPWPQGTTVRVLSVVEAVPLPATELWYDTDNLVERAQQELQTRAKALVERVTQALQSSGLLAEPAVREGDPRSVIVDEAEKWGADLIVLGSHGYTGLQRFLLGSVAQSVVSHAPCSVEVVRAKAAAATG